MTCEEVAATQWSHHKVRAGSYEFNESRALDEGGINQHRKHIEPWLAALLQAEHLNLLIGSGLTTAIAHHNKRAHN